MTDNIINFPRSSGDITIFNKRHVTVEQYANLLIYNVVTKDGSRGIYIEGFADSNESEIFLKELDIFFMNSTEKNE